ISEGTKHCDRYNVFFAAIWKLAKAIDPWGVLITAIATGIIAWFTASIRRVNHDQLLHSRASDRAYISGAGGRQFRRVKRGKEVRSLGAMSRPREFAPHSRGLRRR